MVRSWKPHVPCIKKTPLFLGLNLGHLGFLASIREPEQFLSGLQRFLHGEFRVVKKTMLEADVIRKGKTVFRSNAFNEVVVQHLMGMVELGIHINNAEIQFIRGSGVMVATASGSTSYNLSAHGPIVVPDLQCMIITELLDHNIPTPSIVIKDTAEVEIKVVSFRERGLLSQSSTHQPLDVILNADGATIFPLQIGDRIIIHRSSRLVRFVEFDDNHFFKSLHEKFAFR